MKRKKGDKGFTRRDFLKASGAVTGGLALNLMGPGTPFVFAQAKEPIKLGYVDVETGIFAALGKANLAGVRLAEKHINAKGGIMGRPLKIYYEETEAKAQLAADKTQKLILNEGVIAVHGGTNTAEVISSMGVCKRYGVIHHKYEQDARVVCKSMYKLSYRAANTNAEPIRALAIHFGKNFPNIKRWTTLAPDNAWGQDCWEVFVDAAKKYIKDVQILPPVWNPFGAADFTSYISKIKDLNPQGVIGFNWGGDLVTFVKQQKPLGLMKKITFAHYGSVHDVCLAMGKDMESMWVGLTEGYPTLPHVQSFRKIYEKETGGPIPGDWTVNCYDSVWILKKAIEKAGSSDPKAIMKAVEGMEFEGAAGWVRIRPESHMPDHKLIYVGYLQPTSGLPYFTPHKTAAIPNDRVCVTDEEAKDFGASFPYTE